MTFELTDSLAKAIIFAMEDQTTEFVLDARDSKVVSASDIEIARGEGGFLYPLPAWTSDDGFALMEEFASGTRNAEAHEALASVLREGRGVFRNFKTALRKFPELERRWFSFKNAAMRRAVGLWYDALREFWGLERLNPPSEGTEDLVCDDFFFRDYSEADGELLALGADFALEESRRRGPDFLADALGLMERNLRLDSGEKFGLAAFSVSGEFAGCSLFAEFPAGARSVALLTDFFVMHKFRGLGLGGELFGRSLAVLKKRGFLYAVAAGVLMPEILAPLFERNGFRREGSAFVAKIQA